MQHLSFDKHCWIYKWNCVLWSDETNIKYYGLHRKKSTGSHCYFGLRSLGSMKNSAKYQDILA